MQIFRKENRIMQLKLILKDGTEVDIVEAGYTQHYVVTCADEAAFKGIWEKMTEDNLSEIQITEDGSTVHHHRLLPQWDADGQQPGRNCYRPFLPHRRRVCSGDR